MKVGIIGAGETSESHVPFSKENKGTRFYGNDIMFPLDHLKHPKEEQN